MKKASISVEAFVLYSFTKCKQINEKIITKCIIIFTKRYEIIEKMKNR